MQQEELAALLAEIKKSVAHKRSTGEYPPGLETQLDSEFATLLTADDDLSVTDMVNVRNLVMDKLAIIDHLAMTIVELEARLSVIETSLKSK